MNDESRSITPTWFGLDVKARKLKDFGSIKTYGGVSTGFAGYVSSSSSAYYHFPSRYGMKTALFGKAALGRFELEFDAGTVFFAGTSYFADTGLLLRVYKEFRISLSGSGDYCKRNITDVAGSAKQVIEMYLAAGLGVRYGF